MTTDQTKRPSLGLFIPRHTEHRDPKAMEDFAVKVIRHGFTLSEMQAFADSPVPHNGCYEFDDQRQRSISGKNRAFVRRFLDRLRGQQ